MTAVRVLAAVLIALVLVLWFSHAVERSELIGTSVGDPREDVVLIQAPTTTTSTTFRQPVHVRKITPTTIRSAPSRQVHAESASTRCGGDLPPCWVMRRESGGDPRAVNPTGCGGRGCYGKWQFDPRTWANFSGYSRADLAPESVQDTKARQLWNHGAGCAHWSAC